MTRQGGTSEHVLHRTSETIGAHVLHRTSETEADQRNVKRQQRITSECQQRIQGPNADAAPAAQAARVAQAKAKAKASMPCAKPQHANETCNVIQGAEQ